ncbi:MAG: hypothetical protein WDN04_00105 [Rhodospirillales bacterium]
MAVTVLAFRIFAVLAAALLVGAFGLLVLMPDGMTLDLALAEFNPALVGHMRHFVQHVLGGGGRGATRSCRCWCGRFGSFRFRWGWCRRGCR